MRTKNKITIPYTYMLKFKPLNHYYYGARYAYGCQPSDLWKTYFSSSRVVHELIEKFDRESFEATVKRTFKTKEECLNFEHQILKGIGASKRPNIINLSNGFNYDISPLGIIERNTRIQKIKTTKHINAVDQKIKERQAFFDLVGGVRRFED